MVKYIFLASNNLIALNHNQQIYGKAYTNASITFNKQYLTVKYNQYIIYTPTFLVFVFFPPSFLSFFLLFINFLSSKVIFFIPSRYTRLHKLIQTIARENLINLRTESAPCNEFMSVSLLPNGSKVTSQGPLMRLSYVRESGNGIIPNPIIQR